MYIKDKIRELRTYPEKIVFKTEVVTSLCIILLGISLGYIAKATDSISFLGDVGTELGVWIFVASLVAAYSRYPLSAAVNTMLFFLSVLASYYLYGHFVLDFFPKAYFMGWLIISLISPLAGFFIWFAKSKGIVGTVVSSFPIAVLFALGYPAFYTHSALLFLTLGFGVILNLLLPRILIQKAIAFGLSILLAVFITAFDFLRIFPF